MRLAALSLPGLLLAAAPPAADRPLPEPVVHLTLVAPSPHEPWMMRVTNEGDRTVRIAADGRLLRFEIEAPDRRRPIRCVLPRPLRPTSFPETRELYLAPGQAYVERVDPELYCFGAREAGALVAGARVRATLGWPKDPFVVEGLSWPPELASQRAISSPPVSIGAPAPKPSSPLPESPDRPSPAPPGGVPDARAPRLEIETPRFLEAASAHDLVMPVVATNAGHRPMVVALRARMIDLEIDGPDGRRICSGSAKKYDAAPREAFRTLRPGASARLAVRLREVCGNDVFLRPGLYRIRATLRADEKPRVRSLDAYSGVARAHEATRVRLLSGAMPFHRTPPVAQAADARGVGP